jgi:hypothetical protein
MNRLLIMVALAGSACERQPQDSAAAPATVVPDAVISTQAPSSKPPSVVPMPKDQVDVDRMILAGYTPHGTHLHPPGVKECPLAQDSETVM